MDKEKLRKKKEKEIKDWWVQILAYPHVQKKYALSVCKSHFLTISIIIIGGNLSKKKRLVNLWLQSVGADELAAL